MAFQTPPLNLLDWLKTSLRKFEDLEKVAAGTESLAGEIADWVGSNAGSRRDAEMIKDFFESLPTELRRVVRSLDSAKDYFRTDPVSYWIRSYIESREKGWLHGNADHEKYIKRMLSLPTDRSEYRDMFDAFSRFRKNLPELTELIESARDQDDMRTEAEQFLQKLASLKAKYDAIYDIAGFYLLKFVPRIHALQERIGLADQRSHTGDEGVPRHRPIEVLFHAGTDIPSLLRQGFKTRDQLGRSALGGGVSRLISFTADLKIAQSIVDGIHEIAAIASGDTSFEDILRRTDREFTPDFIASLNQSGRHAGHPMDSIRQAHDSDQRRGFPNEGGEKYHVLRAYQMYMMAHPTRYNPLFWGVNLGDFAKLDPKAVGMVACRVDMTRIQGYLPSMEEIRAPLEAILSIKQVPYRSPYSRG